MNSKYKQTLPKVGEIYRYRSSSWKNYIAIVDFVWLSDELYVVLLDRDFKTQHRIDETYFHRDWELITDVFRAKSYSKFSSADFLGKL